MAESSIYGHSLCMTSDGDLLVANGDLVDLPGPANLLQALVLRVLTPYGSDRFNTSYGLDVSAIFTQPNTVVLVKQLISMNLVRTLGTDGRVSDVRDVIFEDDPAYLARHPEVSPEQVLDARHRRRWNVDVIVETISNQTVTLPATVGG